ncbi:hypothetical protein MTR67_053627 [Solanum verrucosum]|uniref:RING-type domain-containing protein n=1 Tax=Solanum verrucosum TaxID=315347 RepID=A0AAF1A100_SOLVR|nr:hypothetical protein MTR67_053627 [Solanum verrucosum]
MLGLSPADYLSILAIVFLVLYVIWFIKWVVFRIDTEELAPASAPTPTRTERAVTIDVVIDISNEAIKTLGIKGENSDCSICIEEIKHMEMIFIFPICCHRFHYACIRPWLEKNRTCPLCRTCV